jgi:hypothetical protein
MHDGEAAREVRRAVVPGVQPEGGDPGLTACRRGARCGAVLRARLRAAQTPVETAQPSEIPPERWGPHDALARRAYGQPEHAELPNTTLVFLRYQLLAVAARAESDPRTIGTLFWALCEEVADLRFLEAWHLLLEALRDALSEELHLSPAQLDRFLTAFLLAYPRPYGKSSLFTDEKVESITASPEAAYASRTHAPES